MNWNMKSLQDTKARDRRQGQLRFEIFMMLMICYDAYVEIGILPPPLSYKSPMFGQEKALKASLSLAVLNWAPVKPTFLYT